MDQKLFLAMGHLYSTKQLQTKRDEMVLFELTSENSSKTLNGRNLVFGCFAEAWKRRFYSELLMDVYPLCELAHFERIHSTM